MNTEVELIKITGISPYSVFSGDKRYSFNKGVDSSMFQKGHTYSVSVNVGKNGAKYINRVDGDLGEVNLSGSPTIAEATALDASINQLPASEAVKTAAPAPTFQKKQWPSKAKKSNDNEMSKEEWAAKDQRIKRSGLIQAAVVAVASHVQTVDQLASEAIRLSEAMEKWVDNANNRTSQPQSQQPVSA